MISSHGAQQLILKHSRGRRIKSVDLMDSLGCMLAEKIRVAVPLPHWDNSAMDGFALRWRDTKKASVHEPVFLKINGVLKAGDIASKKLKPATAVKIMTGAPLPAGADAVLAQEDAVIEHGRLKICAPVPKGRHVRRQGEEIRKGTVVDFRNGPIHAGTVAFLAQIGKNKVKIYTKPSIAVLSTGSELIALSQSLTAGKIYDSNTPMLLSALQATGVTPQMVRRLRDDPAQVSRAFERALRLYDIVLLSGGVSVGDYDFSKSVLQRLGVQTVFWKIRQKPGKPFYFGKRGKTLVFGLPGNPASAFICFYEYVYPAIRHWMGLPEPFLRRRKALVKETFKRDAVKTIFLKGQMDAAGHVCILPHQSSHMISSLHAATGFLVVPPQAAKTSTNTTLFFDQLP